MYVNFEKIVEKAKREFDRNPNIKKYMLSDIELARNFILSQVEINDIESPEQLKKEVLSSIYDLAEKFAKISNIKNQVFQYEILNILMKSPNEIEQLYKKVISENKTNENPYYVSKPLEERKKDFIKEFILAIKNMKETRKQEFDLVGEYLQGDKKAKKIIELSKKNMNSEQRKSLETIIKYAKMGETELIKEIMISSKENIEEALKQSYVNILEFIGDFFKEHGLIDKYINLNNQMLRKAGLSELCITKEEFEHNSIFDKRYLEKLKVDELPVMTAFWLNRYTKENQSLNNGIFAINTLDLWKDILKNRQKFEISEEELKAIYCKTEFLKIVNEKMSDSINEKLNNNTADILKKASDVVSVNAQEEVDEVEELVRVPYHDEFEGILPNSYTQIMEDLDTYIPLSSNTVNAYAHKDEIVITQILSYMRSNRIRNWGYINEIGDKEKNDKIVLLGIDYEGYNMPVKVHMHKEDVINGLSEAGLDPIIPIYEGNEDMLVGGKLMKSHIIMNFTDKQEKKIKELMSQSSIPSYLIKMLEHLNFLRDIDKYPKHLMQPITKKGETIFVRNPRRYINLATNEIYIKEKNGSLKGER